MHRVATLARAFERIAHTRMAGVPILHAGLHTEAVGFAAQLDDDGEPGLLGVLLTPWFMNLVWLAPAGAPALPMGASRLRCLGGEVLSFIAAQEEGCHFEACSLFSPMFEFPDQAAARAVAQAVLQSLRQPAPAAQPAAMATIAQATAATAPTAAALGAIASVATAPVAPATAAPARAAKAAEAPAAPAVPPGAPTRRGLLFGRRAAQAGAR